MAEWAVFAVVFVLCALYAWTYLAAYSEHSLSNDEIWSLIHYRSRGPLVCLTDYSEANNHILYNTIASTWTTPGDPSPAAARILSFIAVAGAFVLGCWYFAWRKGSPLTAAVFGLILWASPEFNFINLQARGYGMVVLFTTLVIIGVLEYTERRSLGGLMMTCLAVALGVWTVPFFIVFGGSVLLLLFAFYRTKTTFLAGAVTLAFILLVHAPVMKEISEELDGYSFGQFHEIQAVFRLLDRFLLGGLHQSLQFVVFCAIVVSPWIGRPRAGFTHTGSVILWAGGMLVLFVALAMESAIERVCSFIVIPLGLSLWWAMEAWARNLGGRFAALGMGLSFAIAGTAAMAWRPTMLRDLPCESWQEASALIRETFPDGARVDVANSRGPGWYFAYLDGGKYSIQVGWDETTPLIPRQVVCDSSCRFEEPPLLDPLANPLAIQVDLPQIVDGIHRLMFIPPRDRGLEILSVGHKPGTSSGRSFLAELKLRPHPGHEELMLYSHRLKLDKRPRAYRIDDTTGEKTTTELPVEGKLSGRLWAIPLAQFEGATRIGLSIYLSGESRTSIPGLAIWLN